MKTHKDYSEKEERKNETWDMCIVWGVTIFFVFLLLWAATDVGSGVIEDAVTYKEISVLTEQKKCEELGGEFVIQGMNGYNVYHPEIKYEIICLSPAKEIFNYKVK
jgi:hypothetical protein